MGIIEEDYHNASITTRQQKAKWEPLKKITIMLALQLENRKKKWEPLKKISTMLESQQEKRKWAAIEEDYHNSSITTR